jgi:hypothetical protein
MDQNFIDAEMPFFHAHGFQDIGRTTAGEPLGRTA